MGLDSQKPFAINAAIWNFGFQFLAVQHLVGKATLVALFASKETDVSVSSASVQHYFYLHRLLRVKSYTRAFWIWHAIARILNFSKISVLNFHTQ